MKGREALAWGLAVIGLAWAGGMTWQTRTLASRVSALEPEAARATVLATRVAEAGKALDAARVEQARLQAESETTRQALAAAEAKPAATVPEASRKKNAGSGFRDMMRKTHQMMMEDPAIRDQMRQGLSIQVGMMYEELLKELDLRDPARAGVLEALLDRMMAQAELSMALFDEGLSDEELLRRQDEAYVRIDTAFAGLLSGDQRARLEVYDREMPDRMLLKQVDQQMAPLKLDPIQQERVRAIVVEEQKGAQVKMAANYGGMGGGEGDFRRKTLEEIRKSREELQGMGSGSGGSEGILKSMAESRERMYASVQPLLTPEQFQAFKKQQEAQAQMMEMGLKMMSMDGSEP